MIYDLEASPAQNRIADDDAMTDVAVRRVGIPIYPPENVFPPTYRVWIEDAPEGFHRIRLPRQVGWLDGDNTILFLESHRDRTWVVMCDLSRGLREPIIRRGAVDLTNHSNLVLNPWAVTGLRRERPNQVIVTGKPHPSREEIEFRVRLDEVER